uniref:Uncharacterized protein n=1 Tax=Timema cristinae TaxID=61476 RepID=A0A7R9D3A7_TIMCR|nr:unnamed protein product [Timema cristinae]
MRYKPETVGNGTFQYTQSVLELFIFTINSDQVRCESLYQRYQPHVAVNKSAFDSEGAMFEEKVEKGSDPPERKKLAKGKIPHRRTAPESKALQACVYSRLHRSEA